MTTERAILELVFPEKIFEWFDPVEGKKDDETIHVVFEEKNIPPQNSSETKIISKGFKDITITDFPIRGRRALLTFRRRYWRVEGQKALLKRNIQLAFPGTQLEAEFANFLKEDSRTGGHFTNVYRKAILPPIT